MIAFWEHTCIICCRMTHLPIKINYLHPVWYISTWLLCWFSTPKYNTFPPFHIRVLWCFISFSDCEKYGSIVRNTKYSIIHQTKNYPVKINSKIVRCSSNLIPEMTFWQHFYVDRYITWSTVYLRKWPPSNIADFKMVPTLILYSKM